MDSKEIFNKLVNLVFGGDIDKLVISIGLSETEYYKLMIPKIYNDTYDDIEYNGVDADYFYEIELMDNKKFFVSGSSRWGYIDISKMVPVPMTDEMSAFDDGHDISYIELNLEDEFKKNDISVNQLSVQKIVDDSDVEDSGEVIKEVVDKIKSTLNINISYDLSGAYVRNIVVKSNKHYEDIDEEGNIKIRFSDKYQNRKHGITKIIVAGGRDFIDVAMLNSEITDYIEKQNLGNSIIEIVSGMAKGADKLGLEYARSRHHRIKAMPADWNKGKAAGYLRNEEMAEYAKGGHLIAFWDGYSKGTKHMIDMGDKHDLKVHIVKYEVEKNSIDWLKGQYGFLSMFNITENEPIIYKSNVYKCGEAAFQAEKIYVDDSSKAELQREFCQLTGYQAKEKGKTVQLRSDWEDIKYGILEEINYAKFSRNETLRNQLLSTGDLFITEGNFWHDNEYGDCKCQKCRDIPGQNILGKTLMRVRDRIKQEETNDN